MCNFLNNIRQEPNNWLQSELIDVQGVKRVDVTIRYTISPSCSSVPSATFCKDSFDVNAWESDVKVTSDRIPDPITSNSSYSKFATISGLTGFDQKTSTTALLLHKRYLVLGIRDQGGCKALYSVRVTYNVCPEKTLSDSLVALRETTAPSSELESITVKGSCTTDSVPVQGSLNVTCESNGKWNTSLLEGRCVCKEDMENIGGNCTGLFLVSFLHGSDDVYFYSGTQLTLRRLSIFARTFFFLCIYFYFFYCRSHLLSVIMM